jgi:hypothetical protein
MAKISVESSGNGTAYVSNPNPPNMTEFTIYAYPSEGEHIIDMYAMTENMGSLAISTTTEQTIIYNDNWGHVTITVIFSGEEPPPPPPPPEPDPKRLIAVLAALKHRNRKTFI